VDVRTLFNGGDEWDRVHVGLGGEYVPHEFFRRYFKGKLVSGVFSPRTTLRGAAESPRLFAFHCVGLLLDGWLLGNE
jgi:hypothetical protein